MSRHDMGLYIRYVTGHAHLRRHNKVLGTTQPMTVTLPEPMYQLQDPDDRDIRDDPETRCRLCNLKGHEETPLHIFRECLAVWQARRETFGHYIYEEDDIAEWEPTTLVSFFKTIDLENRQN